MRLEATLTTALLATLLPLAAASEDANRRLLWGDTHLHTSYSPDAYLMRNRTADPDTAYAFAKGLPVVHPFHGARIQIETPLDFLVVSDHAEFMGVVPQIVAGRSVGGRHRDRQALQGARRCGQGDRGLRRPHRAGSTA